MLTRARLVTVLLALAAVAGVTAASSARPDAAPAAASRSSFVVIMTDDQTYQDMVAMPLTRRLIGDAGATFTRSYVSYPLCCPSRATYLTGQYAHNSGVRSNALAEAMPAVVINPRAPWDYVHANSVDVDTDGDFIMSARATWGVYKIDRETGRIVWRLCGKKSTFKLGPGVRFAYQHDAHRRADGAITVFDNAAAPAVRKSSRALAIRLNEKAKTATLVRAVRHPRGYLAATQSNMQTLLGGGIMVGWGSQRSFTEFDPAGRVLWDARTSTGYETYRAYRQPWVGRPFTKPRAAASDEAGAGTDVYASWNGATEVASWEILAGSSAIALTPVGSGPRTGFETRITVPGVPRFVAARAKDAAGQVIGTSPAARVRG